MLPRMDSRTSQRMDGCAHGSQGTEQQSAGAEEATALDANGQRNNCNIPKLMWQFPCRKVNESELGYWEAFLILSQVDDQ